MSRSWRNRCRKKFLDSTSNYTLCQTTISGKHQTWNRVTGSLYINSIRNSLFYDESIQDILRNFLDCYWNVLNSLRPDFLLSARIHLDTSPSRSWTRSELCSLSSRLGLKQNVLIGNTPRTGPSLQEGEQADQT